MSFSDLFVSQAMRDKADVLVANLVAVYPPRGKIKDAVTPKGVEAVLNKLYAEAGQFVAEKKLGIIRRAAFARTVQQALFAQGYPAEMVTQVTSALTMNALVGKQAKVSPTATK